MTEIRHPGKTVKLDDQGFLMNLEDWDEEVAQDLAFNEGIEDLSDEKLEIVKFMREYYRKFNAFPILDYVCKHTHQAKGCVNEEFINPEKAWKIAGLPKLEGIHFVSVDGKRYMLEECC